MNKSIYLVRHGYTGDKHKNRFIGSTDAPLSTKGFNQAGKVALRFKKFSGQMFSSPMTRAIQTACKIGKNFSIIPELAEIDFGDIETLEVDEIIKKYPDLLPKWMKHEKGFKFPGGEGLKHFHKRISKAGDLILKSGSDNILVVAHGGVIRVLICYFLNLNFNKSIMFDIKNTSVTTINMYDDRVVLSGVNDCAHLK